MPDWWVDSDNPKLPGLPAKETMSTLELEEGNIPEARIKCHLVQNKGWG